MKANQRAGGRRWMIGAAIACLAAATPALAAHPVHPLQTDKGWRGAGPQPCRGIDEGITPCPPEPELLAITAGSLFDPQSGALRTNQRIIVRGEKIEAVGPADQVPIPEGARRIDLGDATVLPGLIDAHTHMFNAAKAGISREQAMLIALQNLQNTLRAGFTTIRDLGTHGHGYADVVLRDAILARQVEGPRVQVSTRSIFWSKSPYATPNDPDSPAVAANEQEVREAVRDQVTRGADWVKLYPTSAAYAFDAKGGLTFTTTMPKDLLAAAIDEAHKLKRPVACHAFGGEGLADSIALDCDTIEHAMGLSDAQLAEIARKGLYLDVTFARYTEPYLDDVDDVATKGRFRLSRRFADTVARAGRTKGLKLLVGSGADGVTFAHGTQAEELKALVLVGKLPAADVLRAATLTNAEAMGWQSQIGSIEAGKYADMVVVAKDPLRDITEVERPILVMKGGAIVRDERRPRPD